MNKLKKINETLYLDTDEVVALTIIPNHNGKSKITIYLRNGDKIIEEGNLDDIKAIKKAILGISDY